MIELNQYSLKLYSPNNPHIIFTPQPFSDAEGWYHPLLGYPMCPLIGRYNKGQYRIGDIALHLEFVCKYDEELRMYKCGQRLISLPEYIVYQLRNIPEVIAYNKPKNLKNEPDVHLTHHTPQQIIKLNFIVSFGQIGKDFLNYLNHTYIFSEDVFYGDKLNRTTCNIPIIASIPEGSNIEEEEVQRGISVSEWRSQYMSIHLKGGAPAFSPNNMRLGVKGGKKVVTGNKKATKVEKEGNMPQHKENKKKYKKKVTQPTTNLTQDKVEVKNQQQISQQKQEHKEKQEKQNENKQIGEVQADLFWDQVEQQEKETNDAKQNKVKVEKKKEQNGTHDFHDKNKNHEFVHFYTCVLLEKDHRVNYHWHIEDEYRQQVIKELLQNKTNLNQFMGMYKMAVGVDFLGQQLSKLLNI